LAVSPEEHFGFDDGDGLSSCSPSSLPVSASGLKLSDVEVARKMLQTVNTIAAAIQAHQSLTK
jgi:hypothetical protein